MLSRLTVHFAPAALVQYSKQCVTCRVVGPKSKPQAFKRSWLVIGFHPAWLHCIRLAIKLFHRRVELSTLLRVVFEATFRAEIGIAWRARGRVSVTMSVCACCLGGVQKAAAQARGQTNVTICVCAVWLRRRAEKRSASARPNQRYDLPLCVLPTLCAESGADSNVALCS